MNELICQFCKTQYDFEEHRKVQDMILRMELCAACRSNFEQARRNYRNWGLNCTPGLY